MHKKFLHPNAVVAASVVVAVVLMAVGLFIAGRRPAEGYTHPTVGTLIERVHTTGLVKAATAVDLSFEVSGALAYAGPAVGTHVAAGAQLASLSAETLNAQLAQARAALQVQQAKLDGLKTGARPEDIAVAQAAVDAAESSLAQSHVALAANVRDAYVRADDAIHNKVDQFFTNARASNPMLTFASPDSALANSLQNDRVTLEATLTAWQRDTDSASDATVVDSVAASTAVRLAQVGDYLDRTAHVLSGLQPSSSFPLTTIQKYQGDINAARLAISGALTALTAAQTQEKAASSALASAGAQLARTKAPATESDVHAQEASVAVASANVSAAAAQLGKAYLRAPFAGIITRNDAHLGAVAAPGLPLITMMSDAKFQIEAYLSEVDVAKVHVGDTATFALDGVPGETFDAHVVAVDPAATMQNSVSAYKVTLQSDEVDGRIKNGLTSNIDITAASKDNALSVPSSAVITRGSDHFVMKKGATGAVLVPVTTGITGQGNAVEITSGLSAGDAIMSLITTQ